MPATAHAGVFGDLLQALKQTVSPQEQVPADTQSSRNIQTMPLLVPAKNIDPSPAQGGGDVTIVDDTALLPAEGPSGTIADIERPKNATISRYVVHEGDTLSGIAKMFGVSTNTVLWANDLPSSAKIKIGQVLIILPVNGTKHTVQKGDTLASIAKQYNGDAADIASYNGFETSSAALTLGSEVIIPNGEASVPTTPTSVPKKIANPGPKKAVVRVGAEPAHDVGPAGSSSEVAYYIAPVVRYVETQGIHGYNAVDMAAPVGTPIMASAEGEVIVAKAGGYNGGYGSYVVIQHANGSQTLYGHMSKVATYDGAHVVQGQVIGYVGNTGRSTGPHLHFEIRNGIRNPF